MAAPATHAHLMGMAKPAPKVSRNQLRAAQKAAEGGGYTPPINEALSVAVAQLAATGGVEFVSQDQLSAIRVKQKDSTVAKAPKEVKSKAKPKKAKQVAKPKQPAKQQAETKAEPPKVEERRNLSKAERRALRKEGQAEKRALAQEKRKEKAQAKEAQRKARAAKQEEEQKQQVHTKAKVKPVARPKANKPGKVKEKARIVRLRELRAKYPDRVPEPVVDATQLAAKAAVCEFDFATYLTCLLNGEVKQAKAYLDEVSMGSKPLGQAIISPYVDEIRDASLAGLQPAETFHSDEELTPHVKQKQDDPISRQSTHWIAHYEGGLHEYRFSEKVYAIVRDEEGNIIEEGSCSQIVTQVRSEAYIRWLERNTPINRQVNLVTFDRDGFILNKDFHLRMVTDPVPVMVGNLQVGMEFRMSEQYVPLSWDIERMKHELRGSMSKRARKFYGQEPVAGIVGLRCLSGMEKERTSTLPPAANDEVVPWDDDKADEVAFVPLPNPKLKDSKKEVREFTPETRRRINAHPEYRDHLHLKPLPGPVSWKVTGKHPTWVDRSPETVNNIFMQSMTQPDREFVGLVPTEGYVWDPGPKESNILLGHPSWFDPAKTYVLGKPTKRSVVGTVTRNLSHLVEAEKRIAHRMKLRNQARINLDADCPELNKGWRSLRRMQDPKMKRLHPVTIGYWVRVFAKQREAMREERRMAAWFRRRNRVSVSTDEAFLYKEWHRTAETQTLREEDLQEHLGNMEAVAPSVQPVHHECKRCNDRIQEEKLRAECVERNSLGVMAVNWTKFRRLSKAKATLEAAGKDTAKTGAPVIRATLPPNSSEVSKSGGQVEYNLNSFTEREREAFNATLEGKVFDPTMFRYLTSKVGESINQLVDSCIMRGSVLVPPGLG